MRGKDFKGLYEIYKDYFHIGAAVDSFRLDHYGDLLKKHFDSITPENAMKMENICPIENDFRFDEMDSIVNFAKKNDMLIRGHVLVWNSQLAEWFFSETNGEKLSREVLLERMQKYIGEIVGRYKKDVYCWDVVNEAIDDNEDTFFRKTKWNEFIGDDYIDKAFIFAHETAPDALLFYNDYNYVLKSKREKILQLIKSMKQRNIPIHGIGIQGHWGIHYPDVDEIRRTIESFADLGLMIQLTEMDISMYAWGDNRTDIKEPTTEMLQVQAEKYSKIFEALREYSEVISGVSFWGVADDYTWLDDFPVESRKDWPLLFDEKMAPKQAYDAITSF